MLGSAVPSSQFLTEKILAPIDFKNARVIVEYGAGVGNISIEILRRMRSDAKLLVFELNEDLVEFLKNEYHDSRFIASGHSAADVENNFTAIESRHFFLVNQFQQKSILIKITFQSHTNEIVNVIPSTQIFYAYN